MWPGELLQSHLPFSGVVMGNVLMQGYLAPEGFSFPSQSLSGQQSRKKWNNIMKKVMVKIVCC